MNKKWNIGDRVAVLDKALEGVIIAINPPYITIEDSDGFDEVYHEKEIVMIEPLAYEIMENQIKDDINEAKLPHSIVEDSIDLHLPMLKIRNSHIENPIEFQLNSLREFLYEARKNKVDRLTIIHGKGTGKLKENVLEELKLHKDIVILPIKEHSGQIIIDFTK